MSMQHDNRVIVVGAGPVGAVMTLALVRKGIPVTLLESLPDAADWRRYEEARLALGPNLSRNHAARRYVAS